MPRYSSLVAAKYPVERSLRGSQKKELVILLSSCEE